jgi:acyl-coenzyme A synthetase/AMP-(fatty) acid ligase
MEWLIERMKQWKDDTAIIWRDHEYTYRRILDRVAFWTNELDSLNISLGKVVSLEGDYSINACALLLALTMRKVIIVPLTAAVDAHRDEFFEISEAQVVFSIDEDDNCKIEERHGSITNPITQGLVKMGEPGLVLFSSGSTGKPKASLHNFTKLLEKFRIQRKRMRTLNFLLFDHIGGINTLFYTLSNGGTVVTTRDRNPDNICRLIENYKVELLPTSPTFLSLLLISEAYRNYDMSSLKLITYGTETMPESVLKRVNQVLPNVRLLQTYGLSELGILRSKSKDSDSLWVKVGGEGFETKVVDNILWVKADSAMIGYLNAPIPFTEDGWFITGDAVEVDGDYLRILGRDSDVINIGGEKVYPAEVESVLQMMNGVEEAVVDGERNPITGQIVRATVKLDTGETVAEFRKRMRAFCRDKLSSFKIPQKVVTVNKQMHGERFKKLRQQNQV